jgi:hypothetical protein
LREQSSKPTHADQNPEALATFAATARNDGNRPKDHPERATEETKPIPADPKAKDEAARQVLRAGVERAPGRAQAAVRPSPTEPDRANDRPRQHAFGARRANARRPGYQAASAR